MILFSESQRFNQWWIYLLTLPFVGIFGYGLYTQLILKIPFGNNPFSDGGLIALTCIPFVIFGLLFACNLRTEINDHGISYRFFPFHFKMKTIPWKDIEKSYIRTYSPIGEFGGWGVRYGFKGRRAFNISGNKGLQLVLKNGKQLLIGTRKPEDITTTLSSLNRLDSD